MDTQGYPVQASEPAQKGGSVGSASPLYLLAILLLLAGCMAPKTPVGVVYPRTTPTATSPAVAPTPLTSDFPRLREASRSRRTTGRSRGTGSHLSSTAYCETGLMANGHRTYQGAVAGNRWPLGTRLEVSNSPYGPGTFTVADRIGHGSDLDFAMPGDCDGARTWGRRDVTVRVAS